MATDATSARIGPAALITVAYAKSLYDEKRDHLALFKPLVLDVLARTESPTFTVADVQEQLAVRHHIAMPQNAVSTLLHRIVRMGLLVREHGIYRRSTKELPRLEIKAPKADTEAAYIRLASAFRQHAAVRRKLTIATDDEALRLLMQFLEEQHVGLLLGAPVNLIEQASTKQREIDVAAEFVQQALKGDSELRVTLQGMVEALVLYRVAFLPDFSADRKVSNLKAYFDSGLVRQALGYEGTALQVLANDTMNVLKAAGFQCLVFDKTLDEIRRILALYEYKLGTEEGRRSLHPVPMARHFLTQRYSPSDIREMIALLEPEVHAAGLQIGRLPKHEPRHTFDEAKLARYLTDPVKKDESEPRVVHDVDCIAGVLTLRQGKRSVYLEDAVAIFISSSSLMLRNARRWYREEDPTPGIDPAIHIRALSNQAWLKKPTLLPDFKLHELVALCSVALRPSRETWNRFLRHLESEQRSQRITSDEVTAVIVSALSDRLLLEAELEDEDEDVDATTLDDIVERVKATYAAKAKEAASRAQTEAEEARTQEKAAIAKADEAERNASERLRRMQLSLEGRARKVARICANGIYFFVALMLVVGAIALIATHPFHAGWPGIAVAVAVIIFILLETIGVLDHARRLRNELEAHLTEKFGAWFGLAELRMEDRGTDGPTAL